MDTIELTGKKELDIYVNPQRQNLLRCMQVAGVPMTAKQIADQIGISASSVQHHIRLLRELGLVDQSHTEQIHGITATYYRVLPKTVNIGGLIEDGNQGQRIALMQADLSRTFSGFLSYGAALAENADAGRQHGDLLSGIVHLGRDEAKELYAMIRAFLDAHMESTPGGDAWEYALIAYPLESGEHE
jgi:DNA-binding transcriptional ArsR family regulator